MSIHNIEYGKPKRPRLDIKTETHSPISSYQSNNTDITMIDRPFSNILSKLGQQTKSQLSDKKLIVYDLKGIPLFIYLFWDKKKKRSKYIYIYIIHESYLYS